MRQVSMVTCILLRYTKITTNFSLPAGRQHCRAMFLERNIWKDLKSEIIIALTVMVCIALFEASVNFKGKIMSSLVVAFSWNGQTRGSFVQPKS